VSLDPADPSPGPDRCSDGNGGRDEGARRAWWPRGRCMCRRSGSTSCCCRASQRGLSARAGRVRGVAQRRRARAGEREGESIAHPEWERWTARAVEACAEGIGRTFHKLMLNLRALHPAVEPCGRRCVREDSGRPGLDSKRRELCTLAAIAMQNAPRQLHAHLRGALNTGSSRDEVDEVIAIVEADLTKERALKLWEMWLTCGEGISSVRRVAVRRSRPRAACRRVAWA